ncbi:pyridoxamine 5'-phosphate oxidase family protein [Umezawaea endophytica]|uniref:Pyridoxamine 5'-phosphate oxidase family protein n=1 Tax=Umezawaea endophytica TaxID=1654476 RepID=A0A9X3AEK2_9PSEU|nr:pyridoxamine 5'-phosphate oxidase family protein [Umezawaea endophytica]MCS7476956.1 pyridoxamine 5'-phosphate oxidase family protein [Umezawaea endophytica]
MADLTDRLAFHPGELAAQRVAGTSALAARVRPIISDTIPRGATDFVARQRLLVLGAQDRGGRPWATALVGPEGFLSVVDEHTLRAGAQVVGTDPLAEVLRDEVDVGTLVIDLVARKRLRVNGRWRPVAGGGEVDVHQAFGNCPKYIQARVMGEGPTDPHPVVRRGAELDTAQSVLVSTADTFFIGTAAAGGVDVSHRGGNPGFVEVLSSTELRWPDYVGNAMMMTAGNIDLNPLAGLLFPDWESGATLQVTGTARVRRSAAGSSRGPGNGQETVFTIEESVWAEGAFPAGWSEPVYSRFN